MLTNDILKWAACLVCIFGALCVTLQIDPLNVYLANIGAMLYLIWAIRIREWSIVIVNMSFMVIYSYGIILRLI